MSIIISLHILIQNLNSDRPEKAPQVKAVGRGDKFVNHTTLCWDCIVPHALLESFSASEVKGHIIKLKAIYDFLEVQKQTRYLSHIANELSKKMTFQGHSVHPRMEVIPSNERSYISHK